MTRPVRSSAVSVALLAAALLAPAAAMAESVVALRTIRPQQVLTQGDVKLDPATIAGAHDKIDDVIGQEARVAIYPGRAVMRGTLGRPALVDRNQVVELIFDKGGLVITTEGRALARGGVGERIRVMNLSSRTTLFGTVAPDGSVIVSQ
ncbi:flagellar basal body P-ring formation chaperone FlgA [Citreimonas salinaria]|uniref:Flagella basal body P-ring formation protein FlgA n=1 Tax=Citreimonas salinaria TaxID=321339 RepID=A0A1H3LRL3_9RHOB|nr:flagellar basal body P-ring formation chaperone FlgA [Citreimonas salinaria]SDY67187.1 flagella basal body P-ring formation protein FlgA [Citreimonas salinaria]